MKLYQFITNLFFLANTPAPEYNATYRRISHSVAFVVDQMALKKRYLPLHITLPPRYKQTKHEKQLCSKLHLRMEQA